MSEKHLIYNDQGEQILFVERPVHIGRLIKALVASILTAILLVVAIGLMSYWIDEVALAIVSIIVTLGCVAIVVMVLKLRLSHLQFNFYHDESKDELLLEITMERKPVSLHRYTVRDSSGEVIARLQNDFSGKMRSEQWKCYAPDDALWCVVKEYPPIFGLLRRVPISIFHFLDTKRVFFAGTSNQVIGEFIRGMKGTGLYALNLKADRNHELDRRVALAIGVMLEREYRLWCGIKVE